MSTLQATNLKHASSASNNIVLDSSGNTTIGGNISVTGTTSVGGIPVVTTTGTQTLTNKTLTSPTITGALVSAMASSVITSGTAQNTTSGTSIDFTGIPSWVKRVTVMFNGVSTSGTSVRQIQLGDSGGVEITGYTGSVATTNSAGTGNNAAFAGAGFALQNSGNTTAADTLYGMFAFTNVSGNIWVGTGILVASNAPSTFYISGVKTLSDVLTQVRITTVGGTDTFDAGSINILYE